MMKNVELKPLAAFENSHIKFTFAQVMNQDSEYAYVMMAQEGLMKRIVLGGRKQEVEVFLRKALEGLYPN